MKRQNLWNKALAALISAVMLICTSVAMAQTAVTVEKAGMLTNKVTGSETNLKVTGPLNGTDMKLLREMATSRSLATLDLSEARIVKGGDAYYESKTTEDDVMGESAFYSCTKLRNVTLPATITSIGGNAFARSGLQKVDIPNSVSSIGGDAFAYCSSLATVVIGKRVSRLGQGVFYSSAVKNAYVKPITPTSVPAYLFNSSPRIHVYAEALDEYKASDWKNCGTIVGDLENTYPQEPDPAELAAQRFAACFDDPLCTQLSSTYASMSDDDLTAQMTADGITDDLIAIALKIKNNTWAKYEQYFRVHSYKPYSDAAYWNDKLKSTGGSYMGNPTGIYVKGTENLYVFVSDDIPADATLYLAPSVENHMIESPKAGTRLHKGANVVSGIKDALYYVLYTADTKSMTKPLSQWPMMNIHIEGGVVNGYYELSRHSDADYRALLKAATHFRFTVKGDESVFHFKTSSFRTIWPSSIDKSICWFDSLTVWQKELMGFCESVAAGRRDFYPHNLTGGEAIFPIYYNNPNFAIEGEEADAGWANSTPFRTSYNSVACIRSAFEVTSSSLDDWCSAHECGHNNQKAISLEGCTEVSNNLFSNVVRWIDGLVTSTGTAPMQTMNDFADHVPYYTRNINARLRMYYQLYLYYHQARKNTAFYPTLFNELRKSPLTLYQTYNNNGGLKFVRTVCKVAQEDLSDFFRAWGFFEPCKLTINDYGTYQMAVRQADIDATLAEIQKYPRKNREILFVEDRITDIPTNGFPGTAGQKRRESDKIGQCGNLGQYTDYMETPKPASYTYTQTDSLYCMVGTGGVGFVVLDPEDKLLYGSNCRAFIIPRSIGTDFTIYAIDSDGTLHNVEKAGSAAQTIEMETAGTLADKVQQGVVSLRIKGPINGTDVKLMRQLIDDGYLISLDLSGANIRSGGVAYYSSLRTALNNFGQQFFHECKNLQTIQLPETVTQIGSQALARSGIRTITIPDRVTTIGGDAFAYCDQLHEVVIGKSVRTISQGAFYSSPVRDAYVKPTTPPSVNSYLFSSKPTIHVHAASLAKYQASAWKDYGTIVGDLDEWEEQMTAIDQPTATADEAITAIQHDGQLQLQGLQPGSVVSAYATDGTLLMQAPAANGRATLDLAPLAGRIVIISDGRQRLKVAIQ